MRVIVEVREGYQPLSVGEAGARSSDGMIGGDIYLGRFGKGVGDTAASLLVDRPVAGQVRKQKLKVEILQYVVDEDQTRLFVDIVPNE